MQVACLLALPGASTRLELFQADLLDIGSFDPCVRGANYVFHTASPFVTSNITDAQAQLHVPALEGTRHVFGSIARAVEAGNQAPRVVLTSSVAAIIGKPTDKEGCFDEDDWNFSSKAEGGSGARADCGWGWVRRRRDRQRSQSSRIGGGCASVWRWGGAPVDLRRGGRMQSAVRRHSSTPHRAHTGSPPGDGLDIYRYSKLIAEREAWALAARQQLELATILPSFIVGPPRTPRVDGESLRNMKQVRWRMRSVMWRVRVG